MIVYSFACSTGEMVMLKFAVAFCVTDVSTALRVAMWCMLRLFDLKSHNVLLTRDGTAKIADVGLAKVLTQVCPSNSDTPYPILLSQCRYPSMWRRCNLAFWHMTAIHQVLNEVLNDHTEIFCQRG